MNKKADLIKIILNNRHCEPQQKSATAFAPANIALCKYWGKRDLELNLPVTPSLSISLGLKGTTTQILVNDDLKDIIILNNQLLPTTSPFAERLTTFLNFFRNPYSQRFIINTHSTIPIAAGLASSASGFAALIKTLNILYDWQLEDKALSILARLGSGSACRSLWDGFVEWNVGEMDNGIDSYAYPLLDRWPDLCVGLLIINKDKKNIGSSEAMQLTKNTSILYKSWPKQIDIDMLNLKTSITQRDFMMFGKTIEANALAMHATMLAAWPPIMYFQPETVAAIQKIWRLREAGLEVYFTQDAGPNLKLFFLEKDIGYMLKHFPEIEIIKPFQQ